MKNKLYERWTKDSSPMKIESVPEEETSKGRFFDVLKERGITLPEEMEKYNHHHDARGRFSSADGAAFTTLPKPGNNSKPKEMRQAQGAGGGGAAAAEASAQAPLQTTRSEHYDMAEIATEHGLKQGEDSDAKIISTDLQRASGKDVSEQEAKEMKESIEFYSGVAFTQIRDAQMRPPSDSPILKTYQKNANDIEKFIDLSPKFDKELYRGMAVNETTYNQKFAKIKAGDKVDMKGISSWSSQKDVAENFGSPSEGDRGIILKLPKSKKAASITHISGMGKDEGEAILSCKSKLKVASVKTITITNVLTGGKSKAQEITLEEEE